MDSAKVERLYEYLKKKRARFIERVQVRPDSDVVLLRVGESTLARVASSNSTSRRQLGYLQKAIKRDLGIEVEFIIAKDEAHQELEAGLNALLKMRFPNLVQTCYLSSLESGDADIWLERAIAGNAAMILEVEPVVRDYLQLFKTQLRNLRWVDSTEDLPSLPAILRIMKILAPATIPLIQETLHEGGFKIPSTSWLQNKIDVARRQNFVIRSEDGRYAITEGGLSLIPHSRGTASTDIQRALALGRRKW